MRIIVLTLILTTLAGCTVLFTHPKKTTQQERFNKVASQAAPVLQTTQIFWDKYAIPFIEAENNSDLAFAVGVTHAHLRLGQLEVMRYLSQGRVSELAGPFPPVKSIDHGLRTLNLVASAQRTYDKMEELGREWIEDYTRGINWYIENLDEPTAEHRFFGLELTPFTSLEILTIARLISADLSWAFYIKYLKLSEKPGWQEIYNLAISKRDSDSASYHNEDSPALSKIITNLSKSGSNSLVIAGNKSASGSALIANDPHVGTFLPNFWVLVGMKSPDYHAIGLMLPGVPAIGVGRNKQIAWGGTNMRGISSHLYDLSTLNPEEISIRRERLKRRWWFDTEIEIRESPLGPVFSDLALFDQKKLPGPIALNWIGHQGSDEISAFLKVTRASNWQEFRAAFQGYRVSAFNMLYADQEGNIGMMPAYGQPLLKETEKTLDLIKHPDNPIVSVIPPTEQPNPFNPDSGFIASANNKPFGNPQIPYGYSFSNNDRYDRLHQLTANQEKLTIKNLVEIQLDLFSKSAFDIKNAIQTKLAGHQFVQHNKLYETFKDWDGHYNAESSGAVIFESLMQEAWRQYINIESSTPLMRSYFKGLDNWKPVLSQWIEASSDEELQQRMQNWLNNSAELTHKHPTWGSFLGQSQTPALGLIPVIGRRFKQPSYPASGNNDTLHKSGRSFKPKYQTVNYGSSARHISDLSSIDENYFVLHGGQDGWLNNPNLADQTQLWRKGEYIKIPLSMEKVKEQFIRHVTRLHPET